MTGDRDVSRRYVSIWTYYCNTPGPRRIAIIRLNLNPFACLPAVFLLPPTALSSPIPFFFLFCHSSFTALLSSDQTPTSDRRYLPSTTSALNCKVGLISPSFLVFCGVGFLTVMEKVVECTMIANGEESDVVVDRVRDRVREELDEGNELRLMDTGGVRLAPSAGGGLGGFADGTAVGGDIGDDACTGDDSYTAVEGTVVSDCAERPTGVRENAAENKNVVPNQIVDHGEFAAITPT